jgi:hypothetical protein
MHGQLGPEYAGADRFMRQSAEQIVAIHLKAVQAPDADDLNAALAAQAHYSKAAPNGNLGFSEPK